MRTVRFPRSRMARRKTINCLHQPASTEDRHVAVLQYRVCSFLPLRTP
uniref:Uncharacterized protein n=1 Tax=Arundo donax TaxID=35708 RepID=A0A0A9E7V5_ARUDO